MIDNPAVQRPPGRDKPRIGIEITQSDRCLGGAGGQGVQRGNIDIAMRRIQQHNMKRLEKRGIDRPRVGIIQQFCDKRREQRIIDTHGRQNIGSKLGVGSIAHGRAADHFRLVPERLEGAADLIHHCATGFLVTTSHQLRLDKPLFPVKPWLFIGKLSDKRFQHLRATARCHPVEPRSHQRIGIVRRAYRRHSPMRNNVMRKGRKGRRGAKHLVIVQQQGSAVGRCIPPDGGGEAGCRVNSDIGDAEDRGAAFLQARARAGQWAVRRCRACIACALLRDGKGGTLASGGCRGARSSCAAAGIFSCGGCISSCFCKCGRLCRLACGRHFEYRKLGYRIDRIIDR